MRYLILSDIHSNWQALDAVLESARGRYDRVLCCGDLVGYGGDPNAVVEWVRGNSAATVRGNHDKVCAGLEDREWFNPVARIAAEWTGRTLEPGNLDYLRELPRGPLWVESFQILHGSPADEDEYILNGWTAGQARPYLEAEVSFFGHTHLQGGYQLHRNGVIVLEGPCREESERVLALEHDSLFLINPGSVGQPRDNDPRAAAAIYLPEERLVHYLRVPYDVCGAQSRIRAAHLPEVLAERLTRGH